MRTHERLASRLLPGLVVAALLGAGLPVNATDADAATHTYTHPSSTTINDHKFVKANPTGIAVPTEGYTYGAATPVASGISLSGVSGKITDVNVALSDVWHSYPDDIDLLLVGPHGQEVILMSDAGGTNDLNGIFLNFDDQAAAGLLPDDAQILQGSYHPTNYGWGDNWDSPAPPDATNASSSLSVFNGTDANGTWNLYAYDDGQDDAGTIGHGWQLDVQTDGTSSPYPSTIDVSGASHRVTDVDLGLSNLSHEFPPDVDIMLVGPHGQRAMVMSDAGGVSPVQDVDLVLDDESTEPVPTGSLQSGRYRPQNYAPSPDPMPSPAPSTNGVSSDLSVFDGTDPNGTWRLFVVDDAAGGEGSLGSWSLTIATDTTPPRVKSHTPVSGSVGVPVGTDVVSTLDEKARASTVTTSTVQLFRSGSSTAVPATVTYDPTTRTIRLDPAKALAHARTYKAVVTTLVKDLAGNRLDQNRTKAGRQPATWTFTTG
jgi:subtilisin-like proprotein convertase family protein